MIKRKDTESSPGRTVRSTRDSGPMESSMDLEFSSASRAKKREGNGRMGTG